MSEIEALHGKLLDTNKLYSVIRGLVVGISEKAKQGKYEKEELCDLGFLCREIVSQCEEIRKDVQAVKVLVDKIACISVMKNTLSNPMGEDNIHGKLSTGTPHFRKTVTLPKKDSEEWFNMLEYFGVEPTEIDSKIVKVSWKGVCNHITELTELGKHIPEFLPKIHDDYTVVHRRRQSDE
jgi:hypothetical protein